MLRYPAGYSHNSFAFNSHLNTDGTPNEDNVHATVTIDERALNTQYRDTRDPYHLTTGGQLGRIHKNFTSLLIGGRIQAPDASQLGSLNDREAEMLAAFDPALCLRDSPTTQGAYPFTFRRKTASSILDLQYWMRPTDRPRIFESLAEGGSRRYALSLVAPDPRCYDQTETSINLTPGSPTQDVVNVGNLPAPIKVTIITSAAGSSTFTLTRSGVAFVFDLSLSGASTYIIVMETCAPYGQGRTITRSGVSVFSRKSSDASTWLDAPVGTTSFAITNTTNVTGCQVSWHPAYA